MKVHLLNVREGDCTIIEHSSGRTSMIDICAGNIETETRRLGINLRENVGSNNLRSAISHDSLRGIPFSTSNGRGGNYQMKNSPTNPIDYLKDQLGLKDLHRFISTHPDMDHMDGFDRLCNEIELINFWHTGVYRNAPSFSGSRYKEDDWNSYCRVRNGERDHITVITPKAGCRFSCANGLEGMDHDSLYILSPDPSLVDEAASSGNLNDGSYVILYKSPIGDIIFAGDAHDKTWKYILENYETSVSNCKFLLAPHHGRHSGANFEFLDVVRPSLTLFGCASSEYLAYSAWNNRGLNFITQNQCGNVILEDFNGELGIYIENKSFINNRFAIPTVNTQGYYLYGSL